MSLRGFLIDKLAGGHIDKKVEELVSKGLAEAGSQLQQSEIDAGFRRITDAEIKELSALDQDRMLELSYYLFETNLFAARIIKWTRDFVLGEGVQYEIPDPKVAEIINEFRNDPINLWDLKLENKVLELGLYGEQCWPVFLTEGTGLVRLGYLDPSRIDKVITDPDNVETVIGIRTKKKSGKARKYKTILLGDETEYLGKPALELREKYTDGECFYFTVNNVSNAPRGRSDLLTLIDWLDGYENHLFGELERHDFMKVFIWDVLLKGADQAKIDEYTKNVKVPTAGSVRVHNENEEWDAVSPDLKSHDSAAASRMFRNHVLGGAGFPEHWFGGGGDVNRATAAEMGTPTFKFLAHRQRTVKHVIEYVLRYQVEQAVKIGRLKESSDLTINVSMPEMVAKDLVQTGTAINQVGMALYFAVEKKWLANEEARKVYLSLLAGLGTGVDPESATPIPDEPDDDDDGSDDYE